MENKKKANITIHNVKSQGFKQIHADGASASITPTGYINLNLYSQRHCIPKGTNFELNEDGSLGGFVGITEDSKEGVVRDYEIGAYLDVSTCKSLVKLLEQKIKEQESLTQ
jgi:hypothetical protein